MAPKKTSRFDLRIPFEQKKHFEKALELGGFRSLTAFFISAGSEKADEIMEKQKNWLSQETDRQTFFDSLMNPPLPNTRLKLAMKMHTGYNTK